MQKLGRHISLGFRGVRHGCSVRRVRWPAPAGRRWPGAFAVTPVGSLERRDATGRELPLQNRNPDLCHAVRSFVCPAHLSLLGHTVADGLVYRGLGDTAADRQSLTMPGTVVDQRARVLLQVTGDSVQIPPQRIEFVSFPRQEPTVQCLL